MATTHCLTLYFNMPQPSCRSHASPLRTWNIAVGVVFLLFFIAILFTALFALPPLLIPVTLRNSPLTVLNLNWTLLPFSLITALFHFLAAANVGDYTRNVIGRGVSPLRWTEYAITNALMMITVAAVAGVQDLTLLFFVIPLANISMQWFGLQHEIYAEETMAFLWWGFVPWAIIWAPILAALFDGGALAGWATVAIWFAFITSFAFPAVLLWRSNVYDEPYRNNYRTEIAFLVLSLTAKLGLDLIIVIGRAL